MPPRLDTGFGVRRAHGAGHCPHTGIDRNRQRAAARLGTGTGEDRSAAAHLRARAAYWEGQADRELLAAADEVRPLVVNPVTREDRWSGDEESAAAAERDRALGAGEGPADYWSPGDEL